MTRLTCLDYSDQLGECEAQFKRIARLLSEAFELDGDPSAKEAYVLAWRMERKLEELRLRHPII